ncbi:hypothetical protein GCM10010988_35050 [Cnuibacter physcomitrellae]|uniref:hypothetical protein n=1 Tax=Cnuibacter physcomitrellae TaxID=1619308 RepID=UPI0012F4F015|nr:hypothetical protein [Cnuibacter physcomitrellae]GGI41644.1 hypothetical protein GCM10010988_35050 [Cnuibacter physcomitrellae]
MEWWNGFVGWLGSDTGAYVVSGLVMPAIAILVAGVLAALIARGAVKSLLAKHDRELKIAAIASLIDAAEQAAVWNSLTPQEQILSDRASGQADIQVRLLPIKGADVAANWASHALAEMKRNSATFGYQVEPAVIEFRDRLVEWQQRPGRARRVFQSDLERWSSEDASLESSLLADQERWVAEQHHDRYASQPGGAGQPAASARPSASAEPAIRADDRFSTSTASLTSTTIAPAAPLPPTNDPRPTVQQVLAGRGSRVAASDSPLAELDNTGPGASGSATQSTVDALPPRESSKA